MSKRKEIITKRLIIDGFNLIYKFDHLHTLMRRSELKPAMDGLIEILKKYQKKTNKKIHVFFDGKKEEGVNTKTETRGKIKVTFSIDKTADNLIMNFIKLSQSPGDFTVISSDKQIISYVQRHKAHILLSENFETLINETLSSSSISTIMDDEIKPDPELSDDELSFWEKMFTKQQK